MLRTPLDTWRATLFVSLGLAASACAGRAESRDSDPDPEGVDGTGSESLEELAQPPVILAEHLRCEGGTPFEEAGPGALRCANGIVHRPTAPPHPDCPGCVEQGPAFFNDADLCASDGDCAPGTLCISSIELVESMFSCSGRVAQYYFACQSPGDACGDSSQCGAGERCAIVGGERECLVESVCDNSPVPGRPFLVGAQGRVAGLRVSADWCGAVPAPPEALDACSLALAARHWRAAALMEHASIAAFARFTLQLLQLGAPLELVAKSQAAMRDETEHARRCFALASRYAGVPLGPTALAVAGALAEESLASIVRLAFREGCVGETCAALGASEALALARDPLVRQTLALITRDEQRHAELAWRFVAWALEQDVTGELRDVVQSELARLRDEQTSGSALRGRCLDTETASPLSGHGVLCAGRNSELHQAAIVEIVLPCAERLLAMKADTRRLAAAARAQPG